MKTTQTRPATNNTTTVHNIPGATKVTTLREPTKEATYTLRVEDGMLHINNLSGKPEGIAYTLMAQNPDGSTELITRHVSLAPFQVVEDSAEGKNVLAAWTKN